MRNIKRMVTSAILLPLAACGGGGSAVDGTDAPAANTSVTPVSNLPFQSATAAVSGTSEDFASSLNPINQFTQVAFDPRDANNVTLEGEIPIGDMVIRVSADFSALDIVSEDTRSVIYRQELEPTTIVQLSLVKPDNPVDQLSYSSFGYWLIDDMDEPGLTQTHFAYGILSSREQLDIIGTATYRGLTEGHLLESDNQRSFISGQITLDADFTSGRVTGMLSNLSSINNSTGAISEISDFDISARLSPTENRFQGNLVNADSSASGDLIGHFFGPAAVGEAPPEVAGTWRFGSSGTQAVGAFGARRVAN